MEQNLDRAEAIIEQYGCEQSNLIAIMQEIQGEYKYLSEGALTLIAEKLGISRSLCGEALSVSLPALSLTVSDDDEDGGQLDLPVQSPEEMLTDRLTLRQLLDELDPADRELLILRYFREKTQVETAALLGMTQVQVSRREKKLLAQMREKML